jgi:hypothetical protein
VVDLVVSRQPVGESGQRFISRSLWRDHFRRLGLCSTLPISKFAVTLAREKLPQPNVPQLA